MTTTPSEVHTPLRLPLRIEGNEPTLIVDAKGMAVAAIIGDHIRPEKLAELKLQAAYIVTAVNERPKLLLRIKRLEEALRVGGERERWHIGTMNDGLFIINTKPQPAPVDYPFHDRKDGPTLVIPVSALGSERANEIVTAHNKAVEALLRAPVAVTPDDAMVHSVYAKLSPVLCNLTRHEHEKLIRNALSAALAGEVG